MDLNYCVICGSKLKIRQMTLCGEMVESRARCPACTGCKVRHLRDKILVIKDGLDPRYVVLDKDGYEGLYKTVLDMKCDLILPRSVPEFMILAPDEFLKVCVASLDTSSREDYKKIIKDIHDQENEVEYCEEELSSAQSRLEDLEEERDGYIEAVPVARPNEKTQST